MTGQPGRTPGRWRCLPWCTGAARGGSSSATAPSSMPSPRPALALLALCAATADAKDRRPLSPPPTRPAGTKMDRSLFAERFTQQTWTLKDEHEELGHDGVFAKLDRNGDGELAGTEMRGLVRLPLPPTLVTSTPATAQRRGPNGGAGARRSTSSSRSRAVPARAARPRPPAAAPPRRSRARTPSPPTSTSRPSSRSTRPCSTASSRRRVAARPSRSSSRWTATGTA